MENPNSRRPVAGAAVALVSLAFVLGCGCASLMRSRVNRAEEASAKLEEGIRLASAGRTDAAIGLFSEAAALDPGNVEVRCRLAAALASVPGRAAEASAHLDAAAAAWPEDPAVWIDIGNVHARLGAPDAALAAYAEAQAIDRANPSASFNRGLMELRLGRADAAEATFASYLRLRPRDAEGFYLLGRARMLRADRTGARSAIEECLRLDPDHLLARESLGLVAIEERDFPSAERAFREVLRRDPGNERVARRISGLR